MKWWKSLKYKNTIAFFFSIFFALLLSRIEIFHIFLLQLGNAGYVGAFFAGMLFVSTFTVATGVVILLVLAEQLPLFYMGTVAGFGAVIGDFLIFRFIKDNLIHEITPFYKLLGGNHLTHILTSKYFSWSLPVIGAILIASPLPDEIGISLMGIAKMKTYQFLFLSFILNTIGILLVISTSFFVKP